MRTYDESVTAYMNQIQRDKTIQQNIKEGKFKKFLDFLAGIAIILDLIPPVIEAAKRVFELFLKKRI